MSGHTKFSHTEAQAIASQRNWIRLAPIPLGILAILATRLPGGAALTVDQPITCVGWILLTAYMFFCWTSAFHEAAHQTLFRSQRLSIWLGRLLGTAMFTPYNCYRESHIRHHAYLNRPTDWELWPYSDPRTSVGFRRFYVWFDLIFGFVSSPIIYGRIYFHKDSPIKDLKLRRTIRNEYLGIALFWAAAWTEVWYLGAFRLHVLSVLVPLFLAGMMQSGRKLTEHLGMASYDPLLGTRTVLAANWLIKLLSFLNFDIFVHGPHHRHPRATHDTLRPKMEEYVRENPDVSYPIYTTYWRATLAMAPHMVRNPGCGMNAGAPSDAPKGPSVDDFVSDVTRDTGAAATA